MDQSDGLKGREQWVPFHDDRRKGGPQRYQIDLPITLVIVIQALQVHVQFQYVDIGQHLSLCGRLMTRS